MLIRWILSVVLSSATSAPTPKDIDFLASLNSIFRNILAVFLQIFPAFPPLHPLALPLNYLRPLRDWPTNPVCLNNLPIIHGPLCFIRHVSNKSHCVFRRAGSNSIHRGEREPSSRRI